MLNINYSEFYESEAINSNPFDINVSARILAEHYAEFLVNSSYSAIPKDKMEAAVRIKNEYKTAENKETTQIFGTALEKVKEILYTPNADDLMPKRAWRNLNEFIGSSLDIWGHPHLNYAFYKQLEIMSKIKLSKNLLVIPCSNAKPYSSVGRVKKFMKISNETGLFDVLVFSVIPVFLAPYDASTKYPFSCYSWNHNSTSIPLDNLKYLQSCRYFVEAVRMLGYEKLIFCHSGGLDDRINVLKEVWKFSDETILDIIKIPEYRDIHKFKFSTGELPEPKTFNWGIAKTRFLTSAAVGQFMMDLFGTAVQKYYCQTIQTITQAEKEFAKYDSSKMQEYLKKWRVSGSGSNDSCSIELW